MSRNFSPLIIKLIIFFIISLFVSICKNEVIISVFPEEYIQMVRVSSIISTVISNSTSILLLFIIIISTWYICILSNFIFDIKTFIEASKDLVTVFYFGEVFKFFLIWLFLQEEILNINAEKLDIVAELSNTYFFKFSTYSNISTAFISIIVFGFSLNRNKVELKLITFSTAVLSILILINALI